MTLYASGPVAGGDLKTEDQNLNQGDGENRATADWSGNLITDEHIQRNG